MFDSSREIVWGHYTLDASIVGKVSELLDTFVCLTYIIFVLLFSLNHVVSNVSHSANIQTCSVDILLIKSLLVR